MCLWTYSSGGLHRRCGESYPLGRWIGYIFPHNLDSLSFIYNNIYQNQNSEITQEIDNSTITDFTTMYLMKLKTEHEIEDKVLIQINNFLKDIDSDVSIDLD